MTRLVFVRHAESVHNRDGLISTAVPGPDLSPEGVRQATALADRLRGRLNAVYTSPATRAVRTAEFLAAGQDAPVIVADELVELYAGVLEGTPADTGLVQIDAGWERWMTSGDLDAPVAPGGESATSVIARLRGVVAHIQRDHPSDAGVAVVAHGGILQLAVPALCVNLALDHGRRNWLRNTQTVEAHGDGPDLVCDLWAGADMHATAAAADVSDATAH